jgi:hypothetical protein
MFIYKKKKRERFSHIHVYISTHTKEATRKEKGERTEKKGGAMKDIEVFDGRNLTVNSPPFPH